MKCRAAADLYVLRHPINQNWGGAVQILVQAGDDYGHVIGLLGGAGPFFGGGHQGFGDDLRRRALHVDGGLLQAANAELFAVDIFRFNQSVTVADEQRIGRHKHRAFFVAVILNDSENHAPFIEMQSRILGNKKRRKMAGVGVAQIAGSAVVDGDEERGEAVVAGVTHQMFVEARDELGGAHGFASGHQYLAAQGGLQASHQERGGNSFAGNIGDGNGEVGGTELNKVIVIAADGAGGLADGFDLDAGDA